MSKTVIIYYSYHHKNTKKVVEAIKTQCHVELVSIEQGENLNLKEYDMVGFASGIYHSKLGDTLYTYLNQHKEELKGKKTFLMATGGAGKNKKVLEEFKKIMAENNTLFLGSFYCNGYDTFGPFKLLGGIRKDHPNEEDLKKAVEFYKRIEKE